MSPFFSKEQEDRIQTFFRRFKLAPLLGVLLLMFIIFNIVGILAQASVFAAKDYNLPYPGILPNHPLYTVKVIRDRFLEFFTRDQVAKSELYLLYADKRINMAKMLSDQSEWALAEEMASKSQKYLLKMCDSANRAKGHGSSPELGLLEKGVASGDAHRRMLQEMAKKSPRELRTNYASSLELNSDFRVCWQELLK